MWKILTSLKLTVACLACAMVLVFVGTLAQVEVGLWEAQTRFFHSFVIWCPLGATGFEIPVFPGGYTIGAVLLANLIAAHMTRFKFAWKRSGIILTHFGLILLLLGQLATELLRQESSMTINEGETKNYSEVFRKNEVAVIDTTDPTMDRVVAVPESYLTGRGEISLPGLPFSLRVVRYLVNSTVQTQPFPGATPVQASQGGGIYVREEPKTYKMDRRNLPSATVELVGPDGLTLGSWFLTTWTDAGQAFTYNNHSYAIALRQKRDYKPYRMTLLDFRFDRYPGTNIPKNYSSEIRLENPHTGESRNVLIYMNNPLRYEGETYYQASFNKDTEKGTVLEVVHNPSWLTPYVACTLVIVGLAVQFLTHLIGFIARKRA